MIIFKTLRGIIMMTICGLGPIAVPASAAATSYRAELSSTPFTLATRAMVLGKGLVTATIAGRTLAVSGNYEGLASLATGAFLKLASASGVPGVTFAALKVSKGVAGTIGGSVMLTAEQLASLRAGGVSIVITSTAAPDGNIWGWLVEHPQ